LENGYKRLYNNTGTDAGKWCFTLMNGTKVLRVSKYTSGFAIRKTSRHSLIKTLKAYYSKNQLYI
jgi:hypothetical protein